MGSLRFPAFLLVLLHTTLVQISEEVMNMGMFPEAADYSFDNCRKEMLQMVIKPGGLLEKELKNNTGFKSMWQGNAGCKTVIEGGVPEHTTALQGYVRDDRFRQTFKSIYNKSRGSSTYQDEFPFKSLFFLLSDAMKLLKKNDRKNCPTVYSGMEKNYSAKIGEEVRFKIFFPAKLTYSSATEDAELAEEELGTVFNITSCSVIDVDIKECQSGEIELLISPTEVFIVTNITIVKNSNNHYKEITLMPSHFQSSSNCSSLNSAAKSEGSKESSSSLLSSSLLNPVASLVLVYLYMLTL